MIMARQRQQACYELFKEGLGKTKVVPSQQGYRFYFEGVVVPVDYSPITDSIEEHSEVLSIVELDELENWVRKLIKNKIGEKQ